MLESNKAVFLSYASQDAEAAQRICEALRAGGIEVWFDQSELRGGDVWDQRIRQQVRDCALFVPVISANTASRLEGYFRLEWDLADQRTHMVARNKAFIVPVCIDRTPDSGADVPESFLRVQWTRLPDGQTSTAFCDRVKLLLGGESAAEPQSGEALARPTLPKQTSHRWKIVATAGVLVLLLGGWQAWRLMTPKAVLHVAATAATFAPPPHSIAVLPFVNMSGDKEQEYFSDGLTEELLNSLARINELQVAARTSTFSFKGKDTDIGTIARKLNVGAILEGSVRRSGHTVRVTAQLNNAITGYHLWSQTYDRDLGDVLKLQTDIATAVAGALKVKLMSDLAAKIELGGTHSAPALDAYLRGLRLARIADTTQRCDAAVYAFSEAIAADPKYALAYASRSLIRWDCATYYTADWLQQAVSNGVRSDAARAIDLAPGLVVGYVAMSNLESGLLNFPAADAACARALSLAPSNDQALYYCTLLWASFGRTKAAIALANRGVALDPLNPRSYRAQADTLRLARHYEDSIAAYRRSIAADPGHGEYAYATLGISLYLAGQMPAALAACNMRPGYVRSLVSKAIIYAKLRRRGDASAAMAEVMAQTGDGAAYQYAQIYAQWDDLKSALNWLDKARRLGDPGLIVLRTDALLDPLRKEPRFQAIERALRFPD